MPTPTPRLLTALLFVFFSCVTLASDLCVKSGLSRIAINDDCRTTSVKYIDGDNTYVVQMAQALKEIKRDIDVFHGVYQFAIETPNGELLDLGEFKPWTTSLFQPIWSSALEMTMIYSATTSIRGDELFEKEVFKEGATFCALYKMKPPFLGEVRDCSGDYLAHVRNFSHNISIQPGVIPPNLAWIEARRSFLSGKAVLCREDNVNHSATIVRRTKEGELNYVVELSNYLDETNCQRRNRPNYLVYEIDPVKKSVCFISASEKDSGQRALEAVSHQPSCNP